MSATPYLTTAQAADLLGITKQGVTYLIRDGYFPRKIEPLGPGRGFLLPRKDVLAYAKKRDENRIPKGGRGRKSKAGKELVPAKNVEKNSVASR